VYLVNMLRLLETPNSSFEQKWSVLHSLTEMYSDSQWVIDVFLNYDCDLHGLDVFEQCVAIVCLFACLLACFFRLFRPFLSV